MENHLKFYHFPQDYCSCREKVGRRYRQFYTLLKSGNGNGAEVLNEMKIQKMCCRIRFLSMTLDVMLDRSSDRVTDLTTYPNKSISTRELKPKIEPPEFPQI